MNSTNSLDLENLCRTCMSNRAKISTGSNTKKHKRWIYEKLSGWNEGPTIIELLRSVQPEIQVHVRDKLPKIMCHDCIEQLQMTNEFLQMCKDTDEKFRKMLKLEEQQPPQQPLQLQPPPLVLIKDEVENNSPILKFEMGVDDNDAQPSEFVTQNVSNESFAGSNVIIEDDVNWMSGEGRNMYRSHPNANIQQELTDITYSGEDLLEREAAIGLKHLSHHINLLKETVGFHNRAIVDLVSEIKTMLHNTTVPVSVSERYRSLFPISCFEKLKEVETEITDETRHAMICTLKGIIGNCGIKKELEHIMDISIILAYNVDGKQNKLRLLQYPNFIDALYRAVFTEDLTHKQFLKELRQAFRLAKNRYHKKQSLKRVRQTYSSEDDEQSEEIED